jgi:hypothetical protein
MAAPDAPHSLLADARDAAAGVPSKPMRWIFGGAVLVIAGIAARVVADSHPGEAAHAVRWGRGGHDL